MYLPEHFKRFAKEIAPNRDRREKIKRAVERIQEVVEADGPLSQIAMAPLVAQGSYAGGTMVRPLSNLPDYDIDFVLPLNFTAFPSGIFTNKRTPDYILGYVRDRLSNWYDTRVETRSKCVRIRYQDGFHIDVVPGNPIQAGAFVIADRASGEFINTDPQAMLEWIGELDAVSGGRFRQAILMFKRWRDVTFGAAAAPSGLHLTLLAGHAWLNHRQSKQFRSLAGQDSAMEAFLWDMANAMYLELGSAWGLRLPMPGIVQEDLASTWPVEHQALFMQRLATFIKRAETAITTNREDTAIWRWQRSSATPSSETRRRAMAWRNLSSYRIKPALHEEANEGWAWLDGAWDSGHPIIIRYRRGSERRRRIYLIARTIDSHFRGWYRSEMRSRYGEQALDIRQNQDYVFISKYYRDRLGILDSAAGVHGMVLPNLDAKQPRGLAKAWARLRASLMHSDPYVRIGTWLALAGLALALFALVPIFIRFPQWAPWE